MRHLPPASAVALTSTSAEIPAAAHASSADTERLSMTHAALGRQYNALCGPRERHRAAGRC
eukprot:13474966-Alexandrium_andersonii.AAC.1